MRLNRVARQGGRQHRQQGAEGAEPSAPRQLPKSARRSFAPIAPGPFRAPSWLPRLPPQVPSVQTRRHGTTRKAGVENRQLPATVWSSASYKAETPKPGQSWSVRSISPSSRASRESSVPVSVPPQTQLTLLSAGPRASPRYATPFFPPEGSHRLRPSLPFGAPRVPQLQGLSTAPSVGLLDPDAGPQP